MSTYSIPKTTQPSSEARSIVPASRAAWLCAGGVLLVFLTLTIAASLTRVPWMDEGMFADVALNFRNSGHLGSSVLSPTGYLEWPGVHEYTYWQFPLYLMALGGWFRLVPVTVIWMRLFSVMWGCLFLGSWFVIVRSLSRNEPLALLVSGAVGLDYISVIRASDGRMDMMCAALGLAGLASYCWFRNSHWSRGVIIAAWCGAASLFCHPMGIVMNAWIAAMVLLDWRRIRWGALLAASLPYLIGLGCCLYYIHQAPDVFVAQSKAASQYRVTGMGAVLRGIFNDLNQRYFYFLYFYYYYVGYTGVNKLKVGALVFPLAGVVGLLADHSLQSEALTRRLLFLAFIGYVGVALLDNQKFGTYLLFPISAFTACGAVWLYGRWHKGGRVRLLACCLFAVSVTATLGGILYKIVKDEFRTEYFPAIAAVRSFLPPGGVVMGPSELGFALGFGPPLVDDRYLGFFSGTKPDVFVSDKEHSGTPGGRGPGPARLGRAWVSSRITLREQYHLPFKNNVYSVYVRNDMPASAQPAK